MSEIFAPLQPRRREVWRGRPGEQKPLWAILGQEPPIAWSLANEAYTIDSPGGPLQLMGSDGEAGAPTPPASSTPPASPIPQPGGDPRQQGAPAAGTNDPFQPAGSLDLPTEYPVITGKYGTDNKRRPHHKGVDIRAYQDSNIFAVDDGVVDRVEFNQKGGNQVFIRHDNGYYSGHAHTATPLQPGDRVIRGQVIGHSDGSGGVKPHLHFSYRFGAGGNELNPTRFLPHMRIKGEP